MCQEGFWGFWGKWQRGRPPRRAPDNGKIGILVISAPRLQLRSFATGSEPSVAALRGCDFFCAIECVCGYKECMSYPGAGEAAGEVRLRKPERRQMEWVPQCTDDLVAASPRGRTGAAVVAKPDPCALPEPSQSREGVARGDGPAIDRVGVFCCVAGL